MARHPEKPQNPLISSDAFMDFLEEVISKGLDERNITHVMVKRKRILELIPVGGPRITPLVQIGFLHEVGDDLKSNWNSWVGGT